PVADHRDHSVDHLGLQDLHPDLCHDRWWRDRRAQSGAQCVRLSGGVRRLQLRARLSDRCGHDRAAVVDHGGVLARPTQQGGRDMTSTVTRSGRRWLRRPGRTLAEVTTILVAAVVAFPLYWMLLTALKPQGQIHSQHPRPWTSVLTLDNFRRVFTNQQIGLYFLNSVIIAAVVVVLSLFISFLAAVALSRFRFRGRTVLVLLILIAQMVPVEALTIPLFFLARSAGSVVPVLGLNHLGSLVLVHLTFSLPFAIWMLR